MSSYVYPYFVFIALHRLLSSVHLARAGPCSTTAHTENESNESTDTEENKDRHLTEGKVVMLENFVQLEEGLTVVMRKTGACQSQSKHKHTRKLGIKRQLT
jgi:hypothetical protein